MNAIEKAETTGAVTVRTLRETAEALDCQFVYAFVAAKPLNNILHDQAVRKVRNELAYLNHTMRLENQALTPADPEDEGKRRIGEWLAGPGRRLWDKE